MVRTEADMIVNQINLHHDNPHHNNFHSNNHHNNHTTSTTTITTTTTKMFSTEFSIWRSFRWGRIDQPLLSKRRLRRWSLRRGMAYEWGHWRMSNPNPNRVGGFPLSNHNGEEIIQVLMNVKW